MTARIVARAIALVALGSSTFDCSATQGPTPPHEPLEHLAVAAEPCPPTGDASYAPSQCTASSDCGAGRACMCGGALPGNAPDKPNECVAASCAKDSDCGALWCSPSYPAMCGDGTLGFFCHTASDSCWDYRDCKSGVCSFTGSAWQCVEAHCAG